jgi:RNA recognition motif-containing protein
MFFFARPRDSDLSEFHPKATRTLHVGNISREVVPSQVHDRFKEFGEILEIDIKKPDYALVQFVDIKSFVRDIRTVDGEVNNTNKQNILSGLGSRQIF